MAAPSNLSFEVAGVGAGVALGWALVTNETAEEIIGVTPTTQRPAEDFERGWSSNENDPYTVTMALFDTTPIPGGHSVENFEDYWSSNEFYSPTLVSVELAMFDAGGQALEDFNDNWSNTLSYVIDPALFDTIDTMEDFEENWDNNVALFFTLATFQFNVGGSRHAVEDFEKDYPAEWPTMTTL